MRDLVDHTYGEIQLQSTYLGELVADAVEEAESAVTRAVNAAAEAAHTAKRGLDERTSAFLAWQERYTDSFTDRGTDDGGVDLDLGRVDDVGEVRRLLREGLTLWEDMNRDPAAYRMGEVKWRFDGDDEHNPTYGTIWELLRGTTNGGTKVIRSRR
jgi:acyl-CoA reductase-like NAD-dependent aldehyde dehydrogenase